MPVDNVALNKPPWQSSVYRSARLELAGSQVSGGGNNGRRPGSYGFHTLYETRSWWIVDLLAPHVIAEIHIYKRCGQPAIAARANALDILASRDGATWITLFSYHGTEPFGCDGEPLIVAFEDKTQYRLVKLQLRNDGLLHLDEIEVYGHKMGEAAPTSIHSPDSAASQPGGGLRFAAWERLSGHRAGRSEPPLVSH
jgi:hypothetical protein